MITLLNMVKAIDSAFYFICVVFSSIVFQVKFKPISFIDRSHMQIIQTYGMFLYETALRSLDSNNSNSSRSNRSNSRGFSVYQLCDILVLSTHHTSTIISSVTNISTTLSCHG